MSFATDTDDAAPVDWQPGDGTRYRFLLSAPYEYQGQKCVTLSALGADGRGFCCCELVVGRLVAAGHLFWLLGRPNRWTALAAMGFLRSSGFTTVTLRECAEALNLPSAGDRYDWQDEPRESQP